MAVKKASWFEYEMKVIAAFEKYLSQIEPDTLQELAQTVVNQSGHKIYNYTLTLLKKLQAQGYYTLALSASQQVIAEAFARKYDFDDCIGADYATDGASFTGEKSRIVHDRKGKIIREYTSSHPELSLDGSVAVGDSGGDIGMLELVENPIAFNPSEELLKVAIEKGWKIVIERKNIAYTMESNDGSTILAQTDRF